MFGNMELRLIFPPYCPFQSVMIILLRIHCRTMMRNSKTEAQKLYWLIGFSDRIVNIAEFLKRSLFIFTSSRSSRCQHPYYISIRPHKCLLF